ncbi:hypothetical protein EUX98_g4423 [Antrodiella citrinella]|uniref:Major facilitator superfamily (MFS) profile domain-containing protein n=1 Tax=Antrodiella citrinella TaxID=2447956 RepID=A0A4S4MWU2_9APHY|nr:hypothetical protein EUX98_g4423 [Antrodiella citrinella]
MTSTSESSLHAHTMPDLLQASASLSPSNASISKGSFSTDVSIEAAGLDTVYRRHGRVDLVPMPSDSPSDPLNWPAWRKNLLLGIVAAHAMQGPFSAGKLIPRSPTGATPADELNSDKGMVIPAFTDFSQDFNISLNKAAYLISVPILFLGIFPILWSPISERIGRRPVYLISALVSAACAFAGAYCTSYNTLMVTRIFQAIFICPPQSTGACTVSEMFFEHERGRKMGVWTLLVTIGALAAPLVVGYLVELKGWRTEFYLLAAIHLTIFFLHLFFGPETLYPERSLPSKELEQEKCEAPQSEIKWYDQYIGFRIYSKEPFHVREILRPFAMIVRPVVVLPSLAYAITCAYTSVLMSVLVPSIFGEIFHLTSGQVGLQFIALTVGAVIGELLAGRGSDMLVNWRTKRAGGKRLPEYRLLLAYPGFIFSFIGLIVWGVQLQNATPGVWNVTPDIGSGIALFGLQLVTTVCATYSIESYVPETKDVSAFIVLTRQIFAFIAPFYLPIPFASWGNARAAGLFASLIGLATFMVLACQIWGPAMRRWKTLKNCCR